MRIPNKQIFQDGEKRRVHDLAKENRENDNMDIEVRGLTENYAGSSSFAVSQDTGSGF